MSQKYKVEVNYFIFDTVYYIYDYSKIFELNRQEFTYLFCLLEFTYKQEDCIHQVFLHGSDANFTRHFLIIFELLLFLQQKYNKNDMENYLPRLPVWLIRVSNFQMFLR